MNKLLALFLLISTLLLAQNEVCLDLVDNPNSNSQALSSFTTYVNVLDCFEIYGESQVSDEKVLHAAAVAAELLDNNEDGIVDDPAVEAALRNSNAMMPIFNSEWSSGQDNVFDYYNGCLGAVLYRNEMDPSQSGHWGDDASVEEILHTINACGQLEVYPNVFGVQANSSLMSDAMDIARGGQFFSIPNNYPAEAWYHYDDYTCDYECMAMEYLYWCIVTNMGILADEQTCEGIADEWEPCTPVLFEATDTLMYYLVTDPDYKLPQLAPDGNYCPDLAISVNVNYPKSVTLYSAFPNPFNPATNIKFSVETHGYLSLQIYDIKGRLAETLVSGQFVTGKHQVEWNASRYSSGTYFVSLTSGNKTQTRKLLFLK